MLWYKNAPGMKNFGGKKENWRSHRTCVYIFQQKNPKKNIRIGAFSKAIQLKMMPPQYDFHFEMFFLKNR